MSQSQWLHIPLQTDALLPPGTTGSTVSAPHPPTDRPSSGHLQSELKYPYRQRITNEQNFKRNSLLAVDYLCGSSSRRRKEEERKKERKQASKKRRKNGGKKKRKKERGKKKLLASTQGFLGFPASISKCWDGSQDSKLPLHASHVALPI